MSGHDSLIDRYLAAWNETDPAARRELIARSYAEGARYLDPKLSAEGHAGIDAMVQSVHGMFPGHRFTRRGPVDAHHDRLRFGWAFGPGEGGAPVVTGVDFVTLAPDGRLAEVTGFFDAA
jgi:hypothetical protein